LCGVVYLFVNLFDVVYLFVYLFGVVYFFVYLCGVLKLDVRRLPSGSNPPRPPATEETKAYTAFHSYQCFDSGRGRNRPNFFSQNDMFYAKRYLLSQKGLKLLL